MLPSFGKPTSYSPVKDAKLIEYYPVNSPQGKDCHHFRIRTPRCVDLSKTLLSVSVKITKSDGSAIALKDDNDAAVPPKVYPVNSLFDGLWQNVELSLNGFDVQRDNVHFSHAAVLETLLHSGKNDALMYTGPDNEPSNNSLSDTFPGRKRRAKMLQGSVARVLEGVLKLDLSRQERYLVPNVDISLKLWPNKDSFLLNRIGNETYKLAITHSVLKVMEIELEDEADRNLSMLMSKEASIYNYSKSVTKSFNIPKDSTSATFNISDGPCPSEVFLMMTNALSANGHFAASPFLWLNAGLNSFDLTLNNESVPTRPMTFKFQSDADLSDTIEAYGPIMKDFKNTLLDHETLNDGHTIFYRKLNVNASGQLRMKLTFDSGIVQNMSAVIYCKYPVIMSIRSDGEVNIQA